MANELSEGVILDTARGTLTFRDFASGIDAMRLLYTPVDPNGLYLAPQGSIASGPSGAFLNTNGGTVWAAIGGAAATARYGNTATVDAVNGDDLTGAVNGPSFRTPGAAVAYIVAHGMTGVTIWIFPGTYTLSSTLTVPAGNAVRGLSVQTTRLSMTGGSPGGTLTLLVMEENTRVEDVSLSLTSTDATTNLVGLSLPGNASTTSKLRTSVLTVNNSAVAAGSSTNVYGLLDNGVGSVGPAGFSFNFTRGVTINVYSNGAGQKRGVLVSGANDISLRDTNIYVAQPVDPASTGSYIGVETSNNLAKVDLRTSSVSAPSSAGGYTGSDVLQTLPASHTSGYGIVISPGTDLVHRTAGGAPFSVYGSGNSEFYCMNAVLQDAGIRYFWPGTMSTGGDTDAVSARVSEPVLYQQMSVNARTPPGLGNSATFTLYRSPTGLPGSFTPTTFTLTLSDLQTSASIDTASVSFAVGEYIAVGGHRTAPGVADIFIQFNVY